jgi:hypothetical protein
MKRIVLPVALFALGLSVASLAAAEPPPGKGKNKQSSTTAAVGDPATCHPQISVILKGQFVAAGTGSFTMDVKRSNFHGRDLVGTALTLNVDAKTKFKRNGPAELADFKAGDRLNVQARACKKQKNQGAAQDPSSAPPALLAKRVTGHPAKGSAAESDGVSEQQSP